MEWTTVQWRQSGGGYLIKLDGLLAFRPRKAWSMTEKIEHELLSRRKAFSLFGMTAAFGLALPVTLSALSDAEAQTAGMDRRQDRREGRHERRDDRREGRYARRDARRGGGSKPESTGSGTGTK
jgi:hypothetical protein